MTTKRGLAYQCQSEDCEWFGERSWASGHFVNKHANIQTASLACIPCGVKFAKAKNLTTHLGTFNHKDLEPSITPDSIVRMNIDNFLRQNFKVLSPSASSIAWATRKRSRSASKTKDMTEERRSLLDKFTEKLKSASLEEVEQLLKAPDLVSYVTLGKRSRSPSTASSTATSSQSSHESTTISSDSDSITHSRASSTSVPRTKKTKIGKGSPKSVTAAIHNPASSPKIPSPNPVAPPKAKTPASSKVNPTSSTDHTPARKIRIALKKKSTHISIVKRKATATITSDVSSQPTHPQPERIVKLKPKQDTTKTSFTSLIPM